MPKPSPSVPITATLSPNGTVMILKPSAEFSLPIEKTNEFYAILRSHGATSIKSVNGTGFVVMFDPPISLINTNVILFTWCDLAVANADEVVA